MVKQEHARELFNSMKLNTAAELLDAHLEQAAQQFALFSTGQPYAVEAIDVEESGVL